MKRPTYFPIITATLSVMASLTPRASAQSTDIVAAGLEVTQGVQDLNNSVRLVSQKPAFVRFYARTLQGTATVTAALTATRDGNSVTIAPLNPGGTVDVVAAPDRTGACAPGPNG